MKVLTAECELAMFGPVCLTGGAGGIERIPGGGLHDGNNQPTQHGFLPTRLTEEEEALLLSTAPVYQAVAAGEEAQRKAVLS